MIDKLMQPRSLDEALAAANAYPGARWLAGGTCLIPAQNLGHLKPSGYISLRRVPELSVVEVRNGNLFIGASCSMSVLGSHPEISEWAPMLGKAARATATRQVRSRATIGGNIATLRSDCTLTPCLLALGAQVHLFAQSMPSELDLEQYLRDRMAAPERSVDPLIVGISLPRHHGFQDMSRIGLNNGAGYPIVVTALVIDAATRSLRLGLGGAGPVACRSHPAENFAISQMDWQSLRLDNYTRFGELAAQTCSPPNDPASSSEYRRHAIKIMSNRLMEQATHNQP